MKTKEDTQYEARSHAEAGLLDSHRKKVGARKGAEIEATATRMKGEHCSWGANRN